MAKAKNKTTENDLDVSEFINKISDTPKRIDSQEVLDLMQKLTGENPKMWGSSIIGFGKYHYKYESGREGDFMKIGFAPRKNNLAFYIMPGVEKYDHLLQKLGKYKTGKSCLYINKLNDVDQSILEQLILTSFEYMTKKYG